MILWTTVFSFIEMKPLFTYSSKYYFLETRHCTENNFHLHLTLLFGGNREYLISGKSSSAPIRCLSKVIQWLKPLSLGWPGPKTLEMATLFFLALGCISLKKPKEFSKRKEKNTWYFLSNFIYYIMLAELPK